MKTDHWRVALYYYPEPETEWVNNGRVMQASVLDVGGGGVYTHKQALEVALEFNNAVDRLSPWPTRRAVPYKGTRPTVTEWRLDDDDEDNDGSDGRVHAKDHVEGGETDNETGQGNGREEE